jgi:zinc and cadmium transporter
MSTLSWIILSGLAMSALALVGGVTTLLPPRTLDRILLPLVALAAGSLIGGALFHMLPEAITELGNTLSVYVWLVAGFLTFFILEQYLQWHHCHRPAGPHKHLGHLILLADGLHNFIGGLAVSAAFLIEIRLGIVTWLVAAAHEVPQELGDFGILVHSGWKPRSALLYNAASAITFLLGGLVTYTLSGSVNVVFLVPFAAGNFIYIAAADLIPQITTTEAAQDRAHKKSILLRKIEQSLALTAGLGLLLLTATLA